MENKERKKTHAQTTQWKLLCDAQLFCCHKTRLIIIWHPYKIHIEFSFIKMCLYLDALKHYCNYESTRGLQRAALDCKSNSIQCAFEEREESPISTKPEPNAICFIGINAAFSFVLFITSERARPRSYY